MLQYQTISGELKNLLNKLMQIDKLSDFILVGGTALALRYGHQASIDIDLFADKPFNANELDRYIESVFPESIFMIWLLVIEFSVNLTFND